jgi:hypothetical protein
MACSVRSRGKPATIAFGSGLDSLQSIKPFDSQKPARLLPEISAKTALAISGHCFPFSLKLAQLFHRKVRKISEMVPQVVAAQGMDLTSRT